VHLLVADETATSQTSRVKNSATHGEKLVPCRRNACNLSSQRIVHNVIPGVVVVNSVVVGCEVVTVVVASVVVIISVVVVGC